MTAPVYDPLRIPEETDLPTTIRRVNEDRYRLKGYLGRNLPSSASIRADKFTGTWSQRITKSLAALPAEGGTIDASFLTGNQVFDANVVLDKSNVTIICGSMNCQQGSYQLLANDGLRVLEVTSPFAWSNAGAINGGGARFTYTGTGRQWDFGASASDLRYLDISNLALDCTACGNNAVALTLRRTVVFDLRRLQLTGNSVATGTHGIELIGTGNYTGTGRLVNCHVTVFAAQVYGTGTGAQGMNHVQIVGGAYNGVAGQKGIVIVGGDSVYLDDPDIEGLAVGIETSGGYLAGTARFEGNTVDVAYLSGASYNRPIAVAGSSAPIPVWTDASGNTTNSVATSFGAETSPKGALGRIQVFEEEITLALGATTTDSSANLLPAGAIIDSVTARVTQTITTAATWSVGDATTATRFINASASLTAGLTVVGLEHQQGGVATNAAGPVQGVAAKVRITTNVNPGQGKIRICVMARVFSGPTS